MSRLRVTVVGDALLDTDVCGSASRLAPDAPVPVVDNARHRHRAGGAALAAALARNGGATVRLVTAIGADADGDRLRRLISGSGVDVVDLGRTGETITKTRVMADGAPVARIDSGGRSTVDRWTAEADDALVDTDAILVADYGAGVVDCGRRSLARLAARPLVWDPHPRGAPPVPTTTVATPNLREAMHFAERDRVRAPDGDPIRTATDCAARLRRRWRVARVAVTIGDRGAVYVDGTPIPLVVPATTVAHADACGAGDAFASALVCELARGFLPSEAVATAVAAAGAFVAAQSIPRRGAPDDEQRVVATSGCFDLLHAGHVGMLEAARRLGDRLVVLLNSDASVRRRKGPNRPIVPAADRAAVLRSLACVDDVVIFDEDLPTRALEALKPAIYVKGGDYTLDELPEADALRAWDGQTVIVPYLAGRSTTALLEGISA